ncbi:hypothetical protein ACFY3U_12885 [Micromonospora sp. NPDC000089]|uniref:hypothetical protein n=1 Tax=unclassified Micromonospora TaxID=2617518 RepID=UPI00368575A1
MGGKKKRQVQAFLASAQADILKGTYVDPYARRITFKRYADGSLAAASDELTRDRLEYEFHGDGVIIEIGAVAGAPPQVEPPATVTWR